MGTTHKDRPCRNRATNTFVINEQTDLGELSDPVPEDLNAPGRAYVPGTQGDRRRIKRDAEPKRKRDAAADHLTQKYGTFFELTVNGVTKQITHIAFDSSDYDHSGT